MKLTDLITPAAAADIAEAFNLSGHAMTTTRWGYPQADLGHTFVRVFQIDDGYDVVLIDVKEEILGVTTLTGNLAHPAMLSEIIKMAADTAQGL